MGEFVACFTEQQLKALVIAWLVMLPLAVIGVYAIFTYLVHKVVEWFNPADRWLIDEYLETFDVALRHNHQKQQVRREMHRLAEEYRRQYSP